MKAVFRGEDGSCGFHTGETYDIDITIHVADKNSPHVCPYVSLEKLLENWRPV